MEHFTTLVALIGIVIVVASLLSNALDRSGVPLAIVFLVLGALLGPMGLGLIDIGINSPMLQVLATLGLALVLFTDAVSTDLKDIRRNGWLLGLLLGPGTLIPVAVIALAGWFLLGLPPAAAILLGAALASTDAVVLRRLLNARVLPARAQVALRLETGMNDILLLPIVVLAMTVLAGGGAITGELAQNALGLLLLGPAIGAVVGWLGVMALTRVRAGAGVRRDYEALYAIALAFIAYAVAEAAGGSGFVAAFAAGLTIGAQDLELCDCFVEYGEATSLMLILLTFVAFGSSLIWTGLQVVDPRTLLFAAVALAIRTVVLYALLARAVPPRDRRLIALLGPRGISSLLLCLLPVFAGVPGAERLFTVTCLVVLLSLVVHGTGMAFFLRRHRKHVPTVDPLSASQGLTEESTLEPLRITIDDLKTLWASGEPVVIADARREAAYEADAARAQAAVRLSPDDPVTSAKTLGLPRNATVVVFCA
ncbi:MAG TPA: cation:proton antiporter [Candidatus Limnocylindria bacterium]|nr:cation:proton antiporter [Candidatus Limnocylindria bacterium]